MRTIFAMLVVIVTGFAAYVWLRYDADITAARARVAPGIAKVAQTACGPIEYAEAGEGIPLLVIHGAGGGFDQGLEFVEPLARSGVHLIAVSRFGYLGTPLPADASAQAQARAHACLLDALGIRSIAVLGGSAGAPSAMQFAILYPERTTRLVLLVPAAYVPRPGNAPPLETPPGLPALFRTALDSDFIFWALVRAAPDLAIRAIVATPPEVVKGASETEQARVRRILEHVLPIRQRRLGLINDAAVTGSLKRFDLERIAAPTLAFSAEDDFFGTLPGARYTCEQVRGARLVVYPSGGHLLVGHQDEVAAEVVRFLRST